MGYQTDLSGEWEITPPLTEEHREFLVKFNETRRVARDVDSKYGVEGEWYVDGTGPYGQDHDETVISSDPPSPQPGLWCQWVPNEKGDHYGWDGNEKFYDYIEWIKYMVKNWFKPRGYTLDGRVSWFGEERGDMGRIDIDRNNITVAHAVDVTFEYETE